MARIGLRHFCSRFGGETVTVPPCHYCGAASGVAEVSVSMHEAMWFYQQRTGLKPIGEHRPLADRLLSEFTTDCARCGGARGRIEDGELVWCEACAGSGSAPGRHSPEMEGARATVLEQFPGAGVDSEL
jgi:hypothetical protein